MSIWLNWRTAIVKDRHLSFGAKGMALYLNTFMNDYQDSAFPSLATICGEMSIAKGTAIKYLSELELRGFLMKQKRFSKSVIYHALIPDDVVEQIMQQTARSPNRELVHGLNHSSPNREPSEVQGLDPNKQMNKQDKKQEGKNRTRFVPPLPDEIRSYCADRGLPSSAVRHIPDFLDYYESNGWMVGRNRMKSWQHAFSRWVRRNDDQTKGSHDTYAGAI